MLAEELFAKLDKDGVAALAPVLLVLGEETFLVEEVSRRVRETATKGGIPGFNEDRFVAGEAQVDSVLGASRMVPMMAERRFVMVRSVERWEAKTDDDDKPATEKSKTKRSEPPLDRLAAYAADPVPSTVLLLVGTKLHAQRRLVTTAKKQGFLVQCDPVKRGAIPSWVQARARLRGHPMGRDVADHLADLVGTDLGALDDAVERLSLYVGPSQPIGDAAVAKLIAPVQASAIWTLTDAISSRDLGTALRALGTMELGRGEALPTLGAIGATVRRLAKFESALARGESPDAAGQAAGIAPFKVGATLSAVRRLPKGTLPRWIALAAAADFALKGGSKRGPASVIET
ncbi:MAG TPA: DNA polymerase III subunit delta, partial [Polyangiaceae bacterium]|nr:DNA polymerase III subunit delta [Polyangiaceae bacterium]